MKRFEYRTELKDMIFDEEEAVAQFNAWGAAGWQVIFTLPAANSQVRIWLMREIESDGTSHAR